MTAQLRSLSLNVGWIYEVIVCTFSDGTPHAAPVGVWTDDRSTLQMDLYGTSRTLACVLERGQFVVDFPTDTTALFRALHAPDELRFARAVQVEAPCLVDSCATVELSLAGTSVRTDPVRVSGRVEGLTRRGELRLINRAEGLLLESLILTTRVEQRGRDATLAALTENRRVVERVAPGSTYLQAIDDLVRGLRAGS